MISTYSILYLIGLLMTLAFYASGQGQKLYKSFRERYPEIPEKQAKLSVQLTIVIYVLLWFIFMPFLIITNGFSK